MSTVAFRSHLSFVDIWRRHRMASKYSLHSEAVSLQVLLCVSINNIYNNKKVLSQIDLGMNDT